MDSSAWNEKSVIIYSSSCHSKHICLYFFCRAHFLRNVCVLFWTLLTFVKQTKNLSQKESHSGLKWHEGNNWFIMAIYTLNTSNTHSQGQNHLIFCICIFWTWAYALLRIRSKDPIQPSWLNNLQSARINHRINPQMVPWDSYRVSFPEETVF